MKQRRERFGGVPRQRRLELALRAEVDVQTIERLLEGGKARYRPSIRARRILVEEGLLKEE